MWTETLMGLALIACVAGVIFLTRAALRGIDPVKPGVETVTVLRCTGEAAGLEAAVRGLAGRRGRILIEDDGMTTEALRRAETLALRTGALIVGRDKITEEIEEF